MTVVNPEAQIATLGTKVLIRDPDAAANTLFATYQLVPGAGTVQLPNDQANLNEVVTLRGVGQAPAFQRLGTATITLTKYLPYHPAIQLLRSKRGTKNKVLVRLLIEGEKIITTASANTVVGTSAGVFTPNADALLELDGVVQEGQMFKAGNKNYVVYEVTTAASGKLASFKAAEPDGSLPSAQVPAFAITLQMPTITYDNISCSVTGLGDGTLDPESLMGSELVLSPENAIGNPNLTLV